MDGLLIHDSYEPYYAGRERRKEKPPRPPVLRRADAKDAATQPAALLPVNLPKPWERLPRQ